MNERETSGDVVLEQRMKDKINRSITFALEKYSHYPPESRVNDMVGKLLGSVIILEGECLIYLEENSSPEILNQEQAQKFVTLAREEISKAATEKIGITADEAEEYFNLKYIGTDLHTFISTQ